VSGTACLDLRHLDLPGAIAAYVLPGDEPTVVDPGPTTTLPVLLEGLRELGVGPRDLRHVALTHVHLDHAGATGLLLEAFPDARFVMHALDHPSIALQAPSAASWYGHAVTPPRAPDVPAEHGGTLEVGRHRFTLLHTPGHTPGSVKIGRAHV